MFERFVADNLQLFAESGTLKPIVLRAEEVSPARIAGQKSSMRDCGGARRSAPSSATIPANSR
jgi:hypothetical protein